MRNNYWVLVTIVAFYALAFECANALDEETRSISVKYSKNDIGVNFLGEDPSGTCGQGLTWILELSTNTLTINGTGAMAYFSSSSQVPWKENRSLIHTVIVEDGVTSIGHYAFYSCKNLKSISIPSSVSSIGAHSFYGCYNLTSLKIPHGVTSLASDAFNSCRYLRKIELPDSLKHIGDSCFYQCPLLESIVLPYGLQSIGECAFCYCQSLVSVLIPSTVNKIGDDPFGACLNLTFIDVNESNSHFVSDDGVLIDTVARRLLDFPIAKKGDYIIPNFVKSIGRSAFRGCTGLTSVVIPENVTSISDEAFLGCRNLKSANIPRGIKTISVQAFQDCRSLKSIIIPEGVTTIQINAFSCCSSLTTLAIPSTVTSIGKDAFNSCIGLRSISYNGTSDLCASRGSFLSVKKLDFLCVPNDYANISFCGINITCKSSSCNELQASNNECYEVIADDSYSATVVKRPEAIEWEKQTNGCVEYQCNNKSGMLQLGICDNTKDEEFICTNESTCVNKKSIVGYGWTVEIEIDATGELFMNTTEIQLSILEVSGINTDNVIVGTELNEKGEIIRIIIYIDEEESAIRIMESIEQIQGDDKCKYGVLCRAKRVQVKKNTSFSLSKSSFIYPSFLLYLFFFLFCYLW